MELEILEQYEKVKDQISEEEFLRKIDGIMQDYKDIDFVKDIDVARMIVGDFIDESDSINNEIQNEDIESKQINESLNNMLNKMREINKLYSNSAFKMRSIGSNLEVCIISMRNNSSNVNRNIEDLGLSLNRFSLEVNENFPIIFQYHKEILNEYIELLEKYGFDLKERFENAQNVENYIDSEINERKNEINDFINFKQNLKSSTNLGNRYNMFLTQAIRSCDLMIKYTHCILTIIADFIEKKETIINNNLEKKGKEILDLL